MMDNGISIDLVSVAVPALHLVPLFHYKESGLNANSGSDAQAKFGMLGHNVPDNQTNLQSTGLENAAWMVPGGTRLFAQGAHGSEYVGGPVRADLNSVLESSATSMVGRMASASAAAATAGGTVFFLTHAKPN